MSRSTKIVIVLGLALMLLAGGGWGYVYASSSRLVSHAPSPEAYVATQKPEIKAAWPNASGVRLTSATLTLDGQDVSSSVVKTQSGFRYVPPAGLAQGEHDVTAVLKYSVFLIPKEIGLSWTFTVDTLAPVLRVNDGHSVYATNKNVDFIAGYTEPGSTVSGTLGTSQIAPSVQENGVFRAQINTVGNTAALRIVATDPAGNKSAKNIKVIKDTRAPWVKWMSPADKEVLHGEKYSVLARVVERRSFVRSARVYVDGRRLAVTLKKDVLATPKLSGLKDGNHKLKLELVDGAGNTTVKNTQFSTDSRKIVVSRDLRRLFLYKSGKLWKTYGVAIGQPRYPTPTGEFVIEAKRYRPTWVNPKQGWSANMPASIGPGPGNPLGTRAMNISSPGIRIHGTYAAYSIGTAASHGCVRMRLSDVEELFDLVDVGTPVKIY